MGKLDTFKISFNNHHRVYYPGQVLEGHVTIELSEAMKMRGLVLRFQGKASVHWTERVSQSNNPRTRRTKHFTGSETYFEQELLLLGRMKNQPGDDVQLTSGRHVYPFAVQLPPELPSSFEGEYGHVRYIIKGTIDRPWKFDHTTKRPFTIISLLDLNGEPSASMPEQGIKTKQFCCGCCTSGPVSATFRLERQGYVPGEAISIMAEIDNKSSRKMNSTSVVLTMTAIFRATRRTKTSRLEVAELRHGQVLAGETDYWNGEQLVVPPLPPSFLTGCRIIDIRYTLTLQVHPSGPGFEFEVPLPVVIGTVPLQHVLCQNLPLPPSVTPPPAYSQSDSHLASVSPDDIAFLPPPSYAECVFGRVDLREEGEEGGGYGDTKYTPLYTWYDWGHANQQQQQHQQEQQHQHQRL